jgi:broad specificity phosphatase PhoE
MTRIYMIRHGRPASGWGDHGADPDPGLDAVGLDQARTASATLLALAERPSLILTSPLRRCRETAAPFAQATGLEPVVEPRVAEIPTPHTLAPAERADWLRAAFQGRWSDIPGDLDYLAWREQVAQALIAHPGAAVFSHFVAINAAVSYALARPEVRIIQPDNASITVFETDGVTLSLIREGSQAETRVL